MDKKRTAREVLFSSSGPVKIDSLIATISTVGNLTKDFPLAERELLITALQHCLNSRNTGSAHQLVHFIGKLGSTDKKDVKKFLLSEIKEVLESFGVGVISKDQLEANRYNKAFKQLLAAHSKDIKTEIKRQLIEKFKEDTYIEKTVKKLKTLDKDITPYALVRFLREDRTPSISYLESLFSVLEIDQLNYLKQG